MKPELRLEQKQVITPQLLLNLKILALPNLELETLVRTELEQNPVLEASLDSSEQTEKENEAMPDIEAETQPPSSNEDLDITEYISDDAYAYPSESEPVFDMTENNSRAKTSLSDNILSLIRQYLNPAELEIAEYIIGNLDDNGFLPISSEEISQRFNIPVQNVHEIINIIQHLEPGGIGSKDLQEALIIQLQILGYQNDSLETKIIRDYYEYFLNRQYNQIIKNLNITESDINQAINILKGLEPRPSRRYLADTATYINPDFAIVWQNDNLSALINDETFPVLRISARYREILQHPKNFSDEEVNFARNKLQSALNLIRAIEARKQLLYKIIAYIIEHQRDFLINGKECIKPIPIKLVAEALHVHISTISRACQGKYIETPVGIYPLKFFFAIGIGNFSRHSLKEKIQNLIAQENKHEPFTDDMIVNILAQQNIKLSRRTVAKYREELQIPNSSERNQP